MPYRRSRSYANKFARRLTVWTSALPNSTTLASTSTAALTASLGAGLLAMRPFTIVRARGIIHVISDQAAQTESYQVGHAHAVVSDQASAVGVTAVPTPYADMGSDLFFVYEQISSTFRFVSGVGFDEPAGVTHIFDSKAMRKVNEDQDVVSVLETSAISSGCVVIDSWRYLIKLH